MIRFAAMVERLGQDPDAWDGWAAGAAQDDRAAAERLLAGQRPRRVVGPEALMAWAGEVAGVPEWLVAASVAVSGDKAEVAALLLPDPAGEVPGLAEVVGRLERCTRVTAHAVMIGLWGRLPVRAAVVVNRLASGTFRVRLAGERPVAGPGGRMRAVMVQAAAARAEVTLALWAGNVLVPVGRFPLVLPETGEIMGWIRANVSGRFGPVRLVPPVHLFEVEFDGLAVNPRRNCGFDLVGARILGWLPDQGQAADRLEDVRARLAGLQER